MNLLSTRQRARLKVSAIALAFLGAAPGLSLPAARPEASESPPPITWEASFVDTGFKTQVMHLKDVTITYGKMSIKADRALATSGDFKNSRWTFDGNVRINADPRGNLRSDEAVVEFEDSQLKRATATGNPAEFDQKRADSEVVARGHADTIVYEVGAGTVRLSNDAWITDGRNDIRGPVIVYSLVEEHVEATTAPGTERVHVTIAPNDAPKLDGPGTNKPKPTADAPAPAPAATGAGASPAPDAQSSASSPASSPAPSQTPLPATSQAAPTSTPRT
jgi:lipopolysaccharide export system protein LptA